MRRILILTQESCPHDLFGKFVLQSRSVRFVPSELTKAFRDGSRLTIIGLSSAEMSLGLTVAKVAHDLLTIELPDGSTVNRHPDFRVRFEV